MSLSELLTGVKGLFFQQPKPGDFNCARVYCGSYIVDTNEYAHKVVHSFRVMHGDADIRPGKLVRIIWVLDDVGFETNPTTDLETFYIYPKSPYIRVVVQGLEKERILTLFKAEPGGKSRMWKQKIGRSSFRLVEPVKGE